MILLVDCGNTSAKWRLVSGGQVLLADTREPKADFALLKAALSSGQCSLEDLSVAVANVSGSTVRGNLVSVMRELSHSEPRIYDASVEKSFAGVTVAYDDLSQLGVDRWLAMLAAFEQFKSSFLLVTVGTATTIDKVSASGKHEGGLIAPGWRLLKESLVKGTENLGVAARAELEGGSNLGANTADCIRFGVSQMLLSYISSAVHQYGSDCSAKILSGGDAGVVSDCLTIDFAIRENLVLDGLLLYCRESGLY